MDNNKVNNHELLKLFPISQEGWDKAVIEHKEYVKEKTAALYKKDEKKS